MVSSITKKGKGSSCFYSSETFLAARLITAGIAFLLVPSLALAGDGEPIDDDDGDDDDDDVSAIQFEIPEVRARPGESVEVPIVVRSDVALSLTAFSVEHDRASVSFGAALLSPQVDAILGSNPDARSQFIYYADEAAGYVQVSLVMDFDAREAITIPPGAVPVATLQFQVGESVLPGRYPLRFSRRGEAEYEGHFEDANRDPVYNLARRDGTPFEEETEHDEGDEPALADGAILVSIIGDVGIFVRGDANVDYTLNISDPIWILNFMFLGGPGLSCEDAADANDDGRLDLSDPVTILNYLFIDNGRAGSMSSVPAIDPTTDLLGCAYY